MKSWRAPRDPIVLLCFLGTIASLGIAFFALTQLRGDLQGPLEEWRITLGTFGLALALATSLIGAIMLIRLAIQRSSLVYGLDRNAIHISQRGSRYLIPLDHVIAVTTPGQAQQPTKPMIVFGYGQPAQQLIVETHRYAYRLAIADRDQFSRELQERRQLGVVQAQPEGLIRARQSLHDFFTSATTQRLLIAALLLNLALWSLLTWRFPTLPETVPVRFDPIGGTAGTRSRSYTLLLPTIASVAWLGNLLLALIMHPRSQLVAELLLLGALIVQLALLLAVWFIVTVAQ